MIRWSDIAAAQPGSALYNDTVRWADRMRDYVKPLYFTFNHEPESSASFANGEAPDFIAAWRKFHDIFVARGATNVKFMWIMTDYSFFVGSNARNDASKWYPGDAYLDAMGADAYNWYNCRTGINTPWWTLETIIRPFRDFGAAHPDKELWLSEYASTEDTASPGRKAQWINQRRHCSRGRTTHSSTASSTSTSRAQTTAGGSPTAAPHRRVPSGLSPRMRSTAAPTHHPRHHHRLPGHVRGVCSSNTNRTNHTVQCRRSVQAGDTLLLFFTANLNPTTTTAPQGWTAVRSADPSGLRARLWTRTATASDAGSTLTVANSEITKADLRVVAYRGAGAMPLDVHAVAVDTVTRTQHTAPSITPTQNGDSVLVYWADKSSTNTNHTVPASLRSWRPRPPAAAAATSPPRSQGWLLLLQALPRALS